MDTQETRVPGGQPYSGTNRIPNIKQFMERLDHEKKGRDAQIDAQSKMKQAQTKPNNDSDIKEHQAGQRRQGKNPRTVRDPVTGKDVVIDDIDDSMLKAAKDPHVSKAHTKSSRDYSMESKLTFARKKN